MNFPAKNDRANKILSKSLQLFNKHGVHDVSAHDICGELGFSPGNFTYHFGKKSEVIRILIESLESELTLVLVEVPGIGTRTEEHTEVGFRLLSVFWKYRFFFNDLNYILSKDQSQRARYLHVKEITVRMLAKIVEAQDASGAIRPVSPPNSAQLLAENIWYICLSYLRLYMIEQPGSSASEKGYRAFASRHLFSFLEPLYGPEIREGLGELLEGSS